MANKALFSSRSAERPQADTVNEAGGRAYSLPAKHALAQVAATGTFHQTYYAHGSAQLDQVRDLVAEIDDDEFVAKLALYARERAFMKDMPAALLVLLSTRDTELTHRIFPRVVDNGRVLRTAFQMVRSGQFGRNSLGSSLRRAFQEWINSASVGQLLSASIGHAPSLRDVLRMARPLPSDDARRALYDFLTGRPLEKWTPANEGDLPEQVRLLRAFRRADDEQTQVDILQSLSVRWDLLADSARGPRVWKEIAQRMGPQALRMNLNTLLRHEVFGSQARSGLLLDVPEATDHEMIALVANRLCDADEVTRSRQFPYQYFAGYRNASDQLPQPIKSALHVAAEVACGNVPELPGPVLVGVDVSGSMGWTVTGNRGGSTSKMTCVDAAALFGAAILRKNPESVVVPFDNHAYEADFDPTDSLLSIASRLAKFGGGGTDCSLPLAHANRSLAGRTFAGCVLVSDNESWIGRGNRRETAVLTEWERFRARQRDLGVRDPKLVCIDIQPYTTTQAPERADIMNVGGFSDAVFRVVAGFLGQSPGGFVAEVDAVEL